ncbi:MAG: metal ABC transporter substrate-binding protein [Thermoplasmatota archaeon]
MRTPRSMPTAQAVGLMVVSLLAAVLAGCTGSNAVRADIVTGGYPEYYLAARIAGTTHSVLLLGKPGTGVHDFDPDAQDIDTMQHAKVVLLHGLSLESWGDKARNAMGAGGPPFFTTAPTPASLGLSHYFAPPPNGDPGLTMDPHTWTDPAAYRQEAKNVEASLVQVFPESAGTLHANAAQLDSDLAILDAAFHAGLQNCARHEVVTNHDAYFYMAHQYNFSQYALHGINPDDAPTQKDVQDAIDAIKRDHLPVIFLEDGTPQSAVQSIQDETHVRVDVLSPNEIKPASGDYVTVQQDNLAKLADALGCRGA